VIVFLSWGDFHALNIWGQSKTPKKEKRMKSLAINTYGIEGTI